ncbi:MAG: nuclear transport factor 2 family protein [Eubacteriales bacterium]|nr:nuclear transport factor 2 family protein [Eubacteriales bacterium]
MKIRKSCDLETLYGHTHPIREDSPELRFMDAVCAGDTEEALSFFHDLKLFGGVKSAIDTPYGRFEGIDGIRQFAQGWLKRFDAQSATLSPIIQTIAGGRVSLEAVINFNVDGEINQVPMFIIGDFRTATTLDEIRIYCHYTFVPGLQAYRKPIFKSAYLEVPDPDLLTGAVREYYAALHHCPAVDVERIMNCIGDHCVFGGYARWEDVGKPATTHEDIRKAYEHMATYIPRCVGMRFETVIDDGRTCVIEWVHIVTRAGREELGRIALSGIAAYERGEDGLLCSIRISDYAGSENTIEWDKVDTPEAKAKAINFVETFPPYVGCKSLEY